MKPVQIALLFVGNPTLALEHLAETLNQRLMSLEIRIERSTGETGVQASFCAPGMSLTIAAVSSPLSADCFIGALDSPLSRPMRGILSDTVARHNRHMMVTVQPRTEPDQGAPADPLARLRLAHATATLLAQWHQPAAVFWRQSNQLLSGAQYLRLAQETTPWALFAQARVKLGGTPGKDVGGRGLRFDEAVDFIGRPILFHACELPMDEMHAAALSFMRHAVLSGAPIPDGHSFSPENGNPVLVRHIAASKDLPRGRFELSAAEAPDDTPHETPDVASVEAPVEAPDEAQHHSATGAPSDTTSTALDRPDPDHPIYLPLQGDETADDSAPAPDEAAPRDQTRSLAVSYLMLVVLPPIGALLLITNLVFGPNAWRTGFIASASIVFALVLGAYTFLSFSDQNNAVVSGDPDIESSVLGN